MRRAVVGWRGDRSGGRFGNGLDGGGGSGVGSVELADGNGGFVDNCGRRAVNPYISIAVWGSR